MCTGCVNIVKMLQGNPEESLCNSKLDITTTSIKECRVALPAALSNIGFGHFGFTSVDAEKAVGKFLDEAFVSCPFVEYFQSMGLGASAKMHSHLIRRVDKQLIKHSEYIIRPILVRA